MKNRLYGMRLKWSYLYDHTAAKKYMPLWSYYLGAIADIVEGLLSLFTLPFGIQITLASYVAEYRMRRSLHVRAAIKTAERETLVKEN